jgi:hypothetical protein
MSFYVPIALMGRGNYLWMAQWLEQSGVKEVEYFEGGWMDNEVEAIQSHLKFEREDDAIAFVLMHGGTCSTELPKKVSKWD